MVKPIPEGYHSVTPYLVVEDAAAAIDFYTRAFGAREVRSMPAEDGVRLMHAHLLINGDSVMLSDDFPEFHSQVDAPPPEGVTLHIDVGDADAWWGRAIEAGAEVRMPLADQFWGRATAS